MEILEIVKTLQSYSENVVSYKLCSEFAHAVTEAVSLLIEQGERLADTESAWIPVTERLPEKGEVVLACGKRHATSGMFQGASRNNPKWWHWKGNTLKEVTHWMPLPEPPKEVE